MVATQTTRDTVGESRAESLAQAFRWMLLARALDEKMANLYRGGRIHGGVFLGRGQEALSVSIGMALRPGDIFAPLIRDLAGRLAFGEPVLDAVRTHLGSVLGPMRGRDGNIHRGRPRAGLYVMISHLGAMISVVNGALLARRLQGRSGTVGATCIGDGGTSTGAFHEALNQAAVERLPLVLVIADNQYAYSTPTSRQYACASLLDRAKGYGVDGHGVDGTDLSACLATLNTAVRRAREGHGPQMVVASLLRLCGHGEHDDAFYVDPRLKESPLGRDCLAVAEQQVLAAGAASPAQIQQWRSQVQQEIEAAVAQVQQEPAPDPYAERWEAISTTRLLDQFAST
ncbi:thiamine pyrophosphate-dependent dehydrogenase E1 component subunit alpha [Fontisphaera persica]|uniref:thiamine pyrophosphate-dependent dehydrogenase E1 component subunit alpha n=1 Tax=Fontisphaera persica TaxID=2974023 RepID=UPI0024C0A2BA|nr:thiamine pyrophosphate-dependent dehydrogenase E1 component subunit alpha [Fontisphaera persica]WCJ59382.1 thiamine pyrophosphate-dependent dehydrogenase E1 component subunit alpha [Fontisphaera persica]